MTRVAVLASVMNENEEELIMRMKINSDAIIINQCSMFSKSIINFDNNKIIWINMDERGAALSRNTALNRCDSEYAIFADNDVCYYNEYEKIISDEFDTHKNADVIFFNYDIENQFRRIQKNDHWKKIHIWNCLKYGTFNIAIRTQAIKKKGISFNQLFGGGGKYGCGEDSLFIKSMLDNGIKIYCSDKVIGSVKQEESTWYNGCTDKYLYDKGALFAALFGKVWVLYGIRYLLRYKNEYKDKYNRKQVYRLLRKGAKEIL